MSRVVGVGIGHRPSGSSKKLTVEATSRNLQSKPLGLSECHLKKLAVEATSRNLQSKPLTHTPTPPHLERTRGPRAL